MPTARFLFFVTVSLGSLALVSANPAAGSVGSGRPSWDFSGSGGTHLIVGNPNIDGRGELYVYEELTPAPILNIRSPERRDFFAVSTSSIGDVDGDGKADILVGAPKSDRGFNNGGAVYIYSGATGSHIRAVLGRAPYTFLGRSVSGAGDLNGDGVNDFIASGWVFADQTTTLPLGRVFAFSGSDGNLLYTFTAPNIDDGFGFGLSALGDVTEDGLSDIAVSAPLAEGDDGALGRVYIFEGKPTPEHGIAHYSALDAYDVIVNDNIERDLFGTLLAFDDQESTADDAVVLVGSVDAISYGPGNQAQFIFSHHKIGSAPFEPAGSTVVPGVVLGDINLDAQVTQADVLGASSQVGQPVGSQTGSADLDGDGVITASDVAAVIANLGAASNVGTLTNDVSQLTTRLTEVTTSSGAITPSIIDDGQPGDPNDGDPPGPGGDCDDDGDDDDTDDNDDDDADDDDDGPTIKPEPPGVTGGFDDGLYAVLPGSGDDTCNDDADDADDADDDDDGDDDDGPCDPCDGLDNAVDVDRPRYIGRGMKNVEFEVNLPNDEWVVGVAGVGGEDNVLQSIGGYTGTFTNRIYSLSVLDEVGKARFKVTAIDPDTDETTCQCYTVNVVEYEPLPVLFSTFIPYDVIPAPPSGGFVANFVGGDSRMWCSIQFPIFEIFFPTDPTYRSSIELEVECKGPILGAGGIPTCYVKHNVGEITAYPAPGVPNFRVPFGRTYSYDDPGPAVPGGPDVLPPVIDTTCVPNNGLPPESPYELAPNAVSDDEDQQSAVFEYVPCSFTPPGIPDLVFMLPNRLTGMCNHALFFRTGANRGELRYALGGAMPLAPLNLAPHIDATVTLDLIWKVDPNTGKQTVNYSATGSSDSFPAYEMYVGGDLKHWWHPGWGGNTVFDLFGPGLDRTIRATGAYDAP